MREKKVNSMHLFLRKMWSFYPGVDFSPLHELSTLNFVLSSFVIYHGMGRSVKILFSYLLISHSLAEVPVKSLHEYMNKALPTH